MRFPHGRKCSWSSRSHPPPPNGTRGATRGSRLRVRTRTTGVQPVPRRRGRDRGPNGQHPRPPGPEPRRRARSRSSLTLHRRSSEARTPVLRASHAPDPPGAWEGSAMVGVHACSGRRGGAQLARADYRERGECSGLWAERRRPARGGPPRARTARLRSSERSWQPGPWGPARRRRTPSRLRRAT